jgi:hypothetical protein
VEEVSPTIKKNKVILKLGMYRIWKINIVRQKKSISKVPLASPVLLYITKISDIGTIMTQKRPMR